MAQFQTAMFKVFNKSGGFRKVPVRYNPSSLTFDKKPKFADISIPGLDAPLKQFVRGETETLGLELFFDTTENGTGANATSVTALTDEFYALVKIDPDTHAPPICAFKWGKHFPGDALPYDQPGQGRSEFIGVVTQVKQDFTLFSSEGTPLRATLTLSLDEYRPLDRQIEQLKLKSPDHHQVHVLERHETLALVAWMRLDDPAQWRHIATANGIEDPRRLEAGRSLLVPPLR